MNASSYENLEVYKLAFQLALDVHELSMLFPKTEQYGRLADQIRRSSKGICANLAEGLSKRMSTADEKRFISMAMGSAEETRVWLDFSAKLKFLPQAKAQGLRDDYVRVCQMLFKLIELRKG